MASLEGTLYLADGFGVTLLDVSDPASPTEVKRVSLGGKIAMKVGVDEETRGLLVLTPTTVERFDVIANAANPVFSARRTLLGALVSEMRVDGRWTYLNSPLATETVFWDGEELNKEGPHDLKAWVSGREVHDGIAERTRLLANSYEVWSE